MNNAIIIEDEAIAAQHLQRLLEELRPQLKVGAIIQTIEEAVEYLQQHDAPDLCFMDIQLADGLAFHIFDKAKVDCPIVFTTAYDQYALQAFKTNGIDYLLKPVSKDELRQALEKVEKLIHPTPDPKLQQLAELFFNQQKHYKSSFLVPRGDKLMPLAIEDIAYLHLADKVCHAHTYNGQQYALEQPLDTIAEQLNPSLFFRANRQYVVAHRAIREISIWPIGRLAVTLCVPTPDRIVVSKARSQVFKQWYTS
ncbi:MAG: response regulator transcription factor [Bacteroidales bacterium]|nr:response regulator transcription factor [Bacteroidales bacterium]